MNSAKKLHRYAKQLAKQLAKQQMPPIDETLLDYLDNNPEYLLDSLQALVDQLHGETDNENLVNAYLLLIHVHLEQIRYQVDRNYDWAKELIVDFQHQVLNLARTGQLPDTLLGQLALALKEAKLAVDPQLFSAIESAMDNRNTATKIVPTDIDDVLAGLAQEIKGDEFDVIQALTEFTYALPIQARVALATEMLVCRFPTLQNAAPLLVLDERKEMRRSVAQVLQGTVHALTPAGLRRLIIIRSWLPEPERPLIDKIIKSARQKGVDCAQWPPATQSEVHATALDGSGAQGFMILSKIGRKTQLSSVLLRLSKGIMDAWSSGPESKRTINKQLSAASTQTPLQTVASEYLTRAVRHHLAVACETQQVPPVGLLGVAEILGAADWQPDRIDVAATTERLFLELPETLRSPSALKKCLQESEFWSLEAGITESWFEDDQAVADLLAKSRTRRLDTLTKRVLAEVIEPRRTIWMEKLLWTVLWFKEKSDSPPDGDALWVNFLRVTWALLQDQPLNAIPLFTDIAKRTVLALRN